MVFPDAFSTRIPEEKLQGLLECLADDPRPSYQEDPTRIYGMKFANYEIKFRVEEDTLIVINVENDI